jgi:ankyrin repeat protein
MKFLILIFTILNLYSNSNEELLKGAKTGNLALVQYAIESKADLESKNEEGETALILASWYGSPAIVDLLLKKGANINSQDKLGYTAIAKASSLGIGRHFEIVESLISNCANLNLKTKEGLSPYILAKINGHEELAKILKKNGAIEEVFFDKEQASREILHSAKLNDYSRFIYASNFKPSYNFSDPTGITALMYSSRNGNKTITKILLQKGAKVNNKDNFGKTALMYSSRRGNSEITSMLLDKGADLDLKDNSGYRAIDWAKEFNQVETVKLLNALE